tara:strand:- start:383 stop:1030 length:648 start_codon:yes stop_codon:yes gene_type:complete
MATTPRISSGLGKLTPELWDRLMATVRTHEATDSVSLRPTNSRSFLARITASVKVNNGVDPATANYDDNQYVWQYNFAEVLPKWASTSDTYPRPTYRSISDGRSGTAGTDETATCAFNLVEIQNTETNAGPGNTITSDSYPLPVENGTLVIITTYYDGEGDADHQNKFSMFAQDNPWVCDDGGAAAAASFDIDLDMGTFIAADMATSKLDFGVFS